MRTMHIFLVVLMTLALVLSTGCTQNRGTRRGVGGVPEKGQRTTEDIQRDRTKRQSIQEYQESQYEESYDSQEDELENY